MDPELKNSFLKELEKNQEKLLRICSVYASDAEDKKDLFQEVLINIWQSMPSFENKSALSTWMFRITLNVCLRLQSKQEKRRSQFLKIDGITIQNIPYEETGSDQYEALAKLRKCIKKLNDADRAVITLYLEELPYREISQIPGSL